MLLKRSSRPEKKSETLEVRLPHSKKEAFMAACEAEGITASHAVRTFVDAYLKRSRRMKLKAICQELTMKLIKNPLKSAGIAGASLVTVLAFGATPSVAQDDAFAKLDTDGDGFITTADKPGAAMIAAFSLTDATNPDTDGDGRISRDEYDALDVNYTSTESGRDVVLVSTGPSAAKVSLDDLSDALGQGVLSLSNLEGVKSVKVTVVPNDEEESDE